MPATAVAVKEEQRVVRPLKVLVPLIREDLQNGKKAAELAGMPHYLAAGEKLIEAKSQMNRGEFKEWVERNFSVSYKQATFYMRLAKDEAERREQKLPAGNFSSISEFIRKTSNPQFNRWPRQAGDDRPEWADPVERVVTRVDTNTLNLKREELKRAEEREAQRKLALQLIDIGYKVLARTLHPDKGGSREAMQRLNAVRDRLKLHA